MKKTLLALVAALSLSACTVVINSENVDTSPRSEIAGSDFFEMQDPAIVELAEIKE